MILTIISSEWGEPICYGIDKGSILGKGAGYVAALTFIDPKAVPYPIHDLPHSALNSNTSRHQGHRLAFIFHKHFPQICIINIHHRAIIGSDNSPRRRNYSHNTLHHNSPIGCNQSHFITNNKGRACIQGNSRHYI